MRVRYAFCAFLLAAVLLCSFAFAHSGGTDGNGGHYDKFTGEYHYHHGHSAHDHPNGVCPYDSDNKTGQSSGSSSSGSAVSTSSSSGIAFYIATDSVDLHARASASSGVLCTAPKYARLTDVGYRSGDWVQVTYLDITGWARVDSLKVPGTSAAAVDAPKPETFFGRELVPMTIKNILIFIGIGFVSGLVLLLVYRAKVGKREEAMKHEAYQREQQSFSDGRKAAEADMKKREAALQERASQLERQRNGLRIAEHTFRTREAEFFAKAQKLKDELPSKNEIIRVKVTDRYGYRTLYHRLDAPCVKHAETITLQTAHELHLLPCKRCKPDDQELLHLPLRAELPKFELIEGGEASGS